MTREHKLAVVLGFGLLLFVGILVSDHFSASQRRVSTVLAAKTPMREMRAAEPVTIQAVQFPQRVAIQPMQQQAMPGQTAPAPVVPAVGVPAELYTLKDGETLYKICQSHYGNGNLWQKLADFNKGTISNPTKLRKGMTIRLPSISVLKGEAPQHLAPTAVVAGVEANTVFVQQAQAQVPALAPVAPTAAEREYIVQKGDTLGAIASREMGSARKWNALFEANKDRLRSPTDLKIGRALRIPADS